MTSQRWFLLVLAAIIAIALVWSFTNELRCTERYEAVSSAQQDGEVIQLEEEKSFNCD